MAVVVGTVLVVVVVNIEGSLVLVVVVAWEMGSAFPPNPTIS